MPTGFTTVSAQHLQDATGTPIALATISFLPVSNNGSPVSFRSGGTMGQTISQAVTAAVVNGAFTIQLADTALTTPVNVGYRVTVIDAAGHTLLAKGYECVQPTGTVWSLDDFVPNFAAQLTVQAGPQGIPGPQGLTGKTPIVLAPSMKRFYAALSTGVVNVGFVGDSITYGADIVFTDNWTYRLTQQLRALYPTVTFNLLNYAISGSGLEDFISDTYVGGSSYQVHQTYSEVPGGTDRPWPTGSVAGQTWKAAVQAVQPDIVFLAHGVNDALAYENAFKGYLDSAVTLFQSWGPAPSLVLVTNYLCETSQGLQQQLDGISRVTREYGKWNGYHVIDAGRTLQQIRDGIDPAASAAQVEQKWLNYTGVNNSSWAFSNPSGATLSADGYVLSITESSGFLGLYQARQVVDFDMTVYLQIPAGSMAQFRYRNPGVTTTIDGYAFNMTQSEVQMYSNQSGSVQPIGVFPYTMAWTPSSYITLRVWVEGARHRIYFTPYGSNAAPTLIADFLNYDHLMKGYIGFADAQSGTGVINWNNPVITYYPFLTTTPTATDTIIFGNVAANAPDILTNPASTGGDGNHHVSSKGSYLVFDPEISRFLRTLSPVVPSQAEVTIEGIALSTTPGGPADASVSHDPVGAIVNIGTGPMGSYDGTLRANFIDLYENSSTGPAINLTDRTGKNTTVVLTTAGTFAHVQHTTSLGAWNTGLNGSSAYQISDTRSGTVPVVIEQGAPTYALHMLQDGSLQLMQTIIISVSASAPTGSPANPNGEFRFTGDGHLWASRAGAWVLIG